MNPIYRRGRRVLQRSIAMRMGHEGPREDPYAWEERIVFINGKTVTLRDGSLGYLRLSVTQTERPHKVLEESEAYESESRSDQMEVAAIRGRFEELTGIDCDEFSRYYQRLHGRAHDDAYGSPSSYE